MDLSQISSLEGENNRLQARVEVLEAALRPFAALAEWHPSHDGCNRILMWMQPVDSGCKYDFGVLKLSDFRAAAEALGEGGIHNDRTATN